MALASHHVMYYKVLRNHDEWLLVVVLALVIYYLILQNSWLFSYFLSVIWRFLLCFDMILSVSVCVWKCTGPLTIRRITTKTPNIMKIWLYRVISQEISAAVNRKEKSYTSYTVKQEKQEQKQRLSPTYMYILSDI